MRIALRAALALAFASAPFLAPRAALADKTKIIVVDIRRAVLDTEEGLRAQAALKRLFDVRQRDITDFEHTLQSKQAAVQQKIQNGTPQASLGKELEELQHLFVELSARRDQYQQEMSVKEQQLTGPILGRVVGLIRKLAAEKGADVIVDKTAAPYFSADLEVTDRAIQMYNSGEANNLPATPGPGAPVPRAPSLSPPPGGAAAPAAPPPAKRP